MGQLNVTSLAHSINLRKRLVASFTLEFIVLDEARFAIWKITALTPGFVRHRNEIFGASQTLDLVVVRVAFITVLDVAWSAPAID